MNELAALRTVDDVIAEYEGKRDAIPDAIKAYDQARDTFIAASAVLGNVRGQIISGSRINERDMAQVLRQSAWLSLY
ncbi:MAG TPA: hypothetical protein VFH85_03535, partial [Gammaproteobacteria bacterium]|nr:hypothetical protein [Gammaproteobacteria bacterium]